MSKDKNKSEITKVPSFVYKTEAGDWEETLSEDKIPSGIKEFYVDSKTVKDKDSLIEKLTQEKENLNSKIKSFEDNKTKLAKLSIELKQKEEELSQRELDAEMGFIKKEEKYFKPQYDRLDQLEKELKEKKDSIDTQEINLRKEQIDIDTKLQALAEEIAQQKAEETFKFNKEISEKKAEEFSKINDEIKTLIEKQTELANADIEKRKSELDEKAKDLLDKQSTLITEQEKLTLEQHKLSAQLDLISTKENDIENRINEGIKQRKTSFEEQEKDLNLEIIRLRNEISFAKQEVNNYADVKQLLNNKSPEIILNELKLAKKELAEEREKAVKITNSANEEKIKGLQSQLVQLQIEIEQAKDAYRALEMQKGNDEVLSENESLKRENERCVREREATNDYCQTLESKIARLSAAYGTAKDRDERIKDIIHPYYENVNQLKHYDVSNGDIEIKWLDNIIDKSSIYGLNFPKRLVYAFHTCLKTAEWSPLTILAGVSGTGKSELPRVYSLFGGLKFLPVAVQPNWDSQESMLGYFNSIDNKFDSQPVLRFLAQATKESSEEYIDGLRETMNMILLDEMNLAHVELYFADFLSKLENRRGKETNLPCVDVKLGAGITPYPLELTRNVLWVGTMNQDETTKSLSDKVLDRGNVLFFPRPKVLVSRKKLNAFPDENFLITENGWKSWCKNSVILNDNEIKPFKETIEKINEALSNVGRALGHRVWQSIEFYMSNYPTICKILKDKNLDDRTGVEKNKLSDEMLIAFEDALVQKVMPKLRGIETSGDSRTKCLDKIRSILTEGVNQRPLKLITDFNLACNNPFGQFIWNSANYITESEEKK